ncbi:hypothetical protein CEUSTIGMA_g6176.t1 [Chlamydomonas eustigma]|uniref:Guanylate cyclase domain-containing protein n=1 Tax=Chlamydomonas eustigma TaxID=1157962 RepID=A0A250X744_9CHLO|nr:hypothetical protein CEUSTIGMA_g6176.t1 [Chlamydomonas eustigma]|eukprot:GAX78739.1 hypothetical protein CEUSTIGMA_g6176.t1 [Chlamydomonas eustigma]
MGHVPKIQGLLCFQSVLTVAAVLSLVSSAKNIGVGNEQLRRLSSSPTVNTCTPANQRVGLLLMFQNTKGQYWANKTGWPMPKNLTAFVESTPVQSGTCLSSNLPSVPLGMYMDTSTSQSPTILPDHCCWYGVSCCTPTTCQGNSDPSCNCTVGLVNGFYLGANNLSGSFVGPLSAVTPLGEFYLLSVACELVEMDLHINSLTLPLPPQLASLNKLQVLNVAYNQLSGTLPDFLGSLPNLQYLDLSGNKITGSVPGSLCSLGLNSPLINLLLLNNQLTGTLNISACGNLNYIDVTNNQLQGSLPAMAPYNRLQTFNAGQNNFTSLLIARHLNTLSMDLNQRLSGTIPATVGSMLSLNALNLKNVNLSGTLPPGLLSLGSLSSLDISNNWISGTIPEDVKYAVSLRTLNLYNNSLTGTIPPSLVQILAMHPGTVDLRLNYMSCCGLGFQHNSDYSFARYTSYNPLAPRLPPGLEFSTLLRSAEGSSSSFGNNCTTCSLLNYIYTGLSCPYLKVVGTPDNPASVLDWYLDPLYTLFEGCQCDVGYIYTTQEQDGINVVTCIPFVPNNSVLSRIQSWLYAVIVIVVAIILAFGAWFFFFRKGSRPQILQSMIDMRKRLKAPPFSGLLSIVVTDVEGFSDLMKASPELMMPALLAHNNIIQKAKLSNFGHTVVQDGDSFSIVFEEAADAVKFCLQVQQMLASHKWPKNLFKDEESDPAPIGLRAFRGISLKMKQMVTSRKSISAKGMGWVGSVIGDSNGEEQSGKEDVSIQPRRRSFFGTIDGEPGINSTTSTKLDRKHASKISFTVGTRKETRRNRSFQGINSPNVSLPLDSEGPTVAVAADATVAGEHTSGQVSEQRSSVDSVVSAGGGSLGGRRGISGRRKAGKHSMAPPPPPPPLASDPESNGHLSNVSDANTGVMESGGSETGILGKGLRLLHTMSSIGSQDGNASARGSDPKPASAPVRKPGVSGLRVRMGIATGTVIPGQGLAESDVMTQAKLISDAAAGGQILVCSSTFKAIKDMTAELGCVTKDGLDLELTEKPSWWMWWRSKDVDRSKEAVLLDMGEYMYPRDMDVPVALTAKNLHLLGTDAAVAAALTASHAAADMPSRASRSFIRDSSFQRRGQIMRIYQVLAPSLVSRGHVFGSKLSLKEEWVCVDEPYFNAPGVATAKLTPADSVKASWSNTACVFAQVDGGKQFATRFRKDAHDMCLELVAVMRSVVRQIPGSYFVRLQEAEMKYICIFRNAEDALYWCLAVQESIMYMDWMTSVLKHWPSEFGDRGETLFRGPRLKMGMCEGIPNSILPDHMGRADYHGACINEAARFMDAGAHGGQVACDERTVQRVFKNWGVLTKGPDDITYRPQTPVRATADPSSPRRYFSSVESHPLFDHRTSATSTNPGSPLPIAESSSWSRWAVTRIASNSSTPSAPTVKIAQVCDADLVEDASHAGGSQKACRDSRAYKGSLYHHPRPLAALPSVSEAGPLGEGAVDSTESPFSNVKSNGIDAATGATGVTPEAVETNSSGVLSKAQSPENGARCADSSDMDSEKKLLKWLDEQKHAQWPRESEEKSGSRISGSDDRAVVQQDSANSSLPGEASSQGLDVAGEQVPEGSEWGQDRKPSAGSEPNLQHGRDKPFWTDPVRLGKSSLGARRSMDRAGGGDWSRSSNQGRAGEGEVGEKGATRRGSTLIKWLAPEDGIRISASLHEQVQSKMWEGKAISCPENRDSAPKPQEERPSEIKEMISPASAAAATVGGDSVRSERTRNDIKLLSKASWNNELPRYPRKHHSVSDAPVGLTKSASMLRWNIFKDSKDGRMISKDGGASQREVVPSAQSSLNRRESIDEGKEDETPEDAMLSPWTWQIPDDSIVPGNWVDVVAIQLGMFRFKGSPEVIPIVNVLPSWLANRRFPQEAPKGKGDRVLELNSVVGASYVPMLQVVTAYRERHEGPLGPLSTPTPITADGESGVRSRMSGNDGPTMVVLKHTMSIVKDRLSQALSRRVAPGSALQDQETAVAARVGTMAPSRPKSAKSAKSRQQSLSVLADITGLIRRPSLDLEEGNYDREEDSNGRTGVMQFSAGSLELPSRETSFMANRPIVKVELPPPKMVHF